MKSKNIANTGAAALKAAGGLAVSEMVNSTVTGFASPLIQVGAGAGLYKMGQKEAGVVMMAYGTLNTIKRLVVKNNDDTTLVSKMLPGQVNPGIIGFQGLPNRLMLDGLPNRLQYGY